MYRKTFVFFLIFLLLCGCSAKQTVPAEAPAPTAEAASSLKEAEESLKEAEEPPAEDEVEFTVDNTVMGTVYGEKIYYTSFRPYLLITDDINDLMIQEEIALNYCLEQEMDRLGVPHTQKAFEDFAADLYYKECLFEPERIDEIETVRGVIGFFKDSMDLALYEGYRQEYYLNCLGDHYAEVYRAGHPQGDMTDEAYEQAAVEEANGKLRQMIDSFKGTYQLKKGSAVITVNGKEIRLQERHRCYMLYTLARERIRIIDAILKGCGMVLEMQRDGFSASSDMEQEIGKYIDSMRADPSFYNKYKQLFETENVTYEQFLTSLRFVLQMQNVAPALYNEYLSKTYETLTENKPETFEEYTEQRLTALYEKCVPVNVMY